MDAGSEPAEEVGGLVLAAAAIGPVAVAGALARVVRPGSLDRTRLGGVGGQPPGPDPVAALDPPAAGEVRLVVAGVVRRQNEAPARQRGGDPVAGAAEGRGVLAPAETPAEAPRRVVRGAADDAAPVLPQPQAPSGGARAAGPTANRRCRARAGHR